MSAVGFQVKINRPVDFVSKTPFYQGLNHFDLFRNMPRGPGLNGGRKVPELIHGPVK